MQPGGKTAASAGAALALAGNKATSASPSVVSAKPKHAPSGAVGGLGLAVDAKRSVTTLAAVVGRAPAFSDDDHLKPKAFSAERIKTMAEETSSLLGRLCLPKQSSIPEQACFSKEVEALHKACIGLVEGAAFDEEGAINTLIGVHARINNLLLLAPDNKQSPEEFLLSSMEQSKSLVEGYMSAQDKTMADAEGRTRLYDMVKNSPLIEPTPTVCSDDEVKEVLQKTLALLESSEPAHSTTGMAGLFYKVRSNCRELVEDIEKNGVDSKTGSAIKLIHVSALFVLGQHKKFFAYEDAADDSLLSSLRRLEVALRDYMLGGQSSETTD